MTKTEQDLKWQAEEDARTIVRVNEIFNDPKRKKRAVVEFEKQRKAVDEAEEMLKLKRGVGR
jgi:hypothetical protein